MRKKDILFAKILEYSWLVIALTSAFTCLHNYSYYGFTQDSLMFVIIAVVSTAMFFFRRHKRKQISIQ